jgi:hypothetical protein
MLLEAPSSILLKRFVEIFEDVGEDGSAETEGATCHYLETIHDSAGGAWKGLTAAIIIDLEYDKVSDSRPKKTSHTSKAVDLLVPLTNVA